MARKLLGSINNGKASVKVYTGPLTDTEEKRRELLEKAAVSFAKGIRRSSPEIFNKIARPVPKDE